MKPFQKATHFVRSLFTHSEKEGKKRETDDTPENSVNRQLYLTLYKIMRDHVFIYITLEDDTEIFQSVILEINPEEKAMIIDDLFPQKHRFVGLEGQRLNIAMQLNGVRHYFKSKIISKIQSGYTTSYSIVIPEALSEVQRRKSFRLTLNASRQYAVRFLNAQIQSQLGKIRNISIDGAGFEVEGDLTPFWQPGGILEACDLIFDGEKVFETDLTIKSCQLIPADNKIMSYIGVEFDELTENQKNKLHKLMIKKQREQLRNNVKPAMN